MNYRLILALSANLAVWSLALGACADCVDYAVAQQRLHGGVIEQVRIADGEEHAVLILADGHILDYRYPGFALTRAQLERRGYVFERPMTWAEVTFHDYIR